MIRQGFEAARQDAGKQSELLNFQGLAGTEILVNIGDLLDRTIDHRAAVGPSGAAAKTAPVAILHEFAPKNYSKRWNATFNWTKAFHFVSCGGKHPAAQGESS